MRSFRFRGALLVLLVNVVAHVLDASTVRGLEPHVPSERRKIKLEIQVINRNPTAGKLKPRKSLRVRYGSSRTFKARPRKGNLAVIRLDGRDVAQGQPSKRVRYKLAKIVTAHTVETLFVPTYTPPSAPGSPQGPAAPGPPEAPAVPGTPQPPAGPGAPQPPAALGASLNDTGVTSCGNAAHNDVACNDVAATTDQYPGQDAEHGRDVTASIPADGHAGFSFLKLDGSGLTLPDQSAAYVVTPWSCVQDQVTRLVWEVRTDDGGLRDKDWRYSWYDSTGVAGGHGRGKPNAGRCGDPKDCDTEKYAAAVNAAGLCGFSDWRLPTRGELLSIVDYGASAAPLLDAAFLPDGVADVYWTASRDAIRGPWSVDFTDGGSRLYGHFEARAVRLVRGGS